MCKVHRWVTDGLVLQFPAYAGHCSECGIRLYYCGPMYGYRDDQMQSVKVLD